MSGKLIPKADTPAPLHVFEEARRQIDEADTVDRVKQILAYTVGLAAAARAATDKEMEAEAAELKLRAERKLGQLMAAQKTTVGLNKGGRPKKTGLAENPVSTEAKPATLAESGIDKNLAQRARSAAAMTDDEFKAVVEQAIAGKRKPVDAEPPFTETAHTHAAAEPATTPRPHPRRTKAQIQADDAKHAAQSVSAAVSAVFAASNVDMIVDCLVTKHLDPLVEIASNPKFKPIVTAIATKLGANGGAVDRESQIRFLGLQSENEELRARLAELEKSGAEG
jgi:hypothetical protein